MSRGLSVVRGTRYLFAYGSLIQRAARMSTVPAAGAAYPVVVHGLRRGWFFQYEPNEGQP